ncbi:MAG: DUF1127 domain-containing protein [Pseudomonadota bacterium]
MSDITQHSAPSSVRSRFSGVRAAFGAFARARSAKTEYNHLMMLSDTALASRGLSRDGIARYIGAKHLDI